VEELRARRVVVGRLLARRRRKALRWFRRATDDLQSI